MVVYDLRECSRSAALVPNGTDTVGPYQLQHLVRHEREQRRARYVAEAAKINWSFSMVTSSAMPPPETAEGSTKRIVLLEPDRWVGGLDLERRRRWRRRTSASTARRDLEASGARPVLRQSFDSRQQLFRGVWE